VAIEAGFKRSLRELGWERPSEPRRLEEGHGVPDGGGRDGEVPADLVVAETPLELEAKDLLGLSHRHSPLRHRPSPLLQLQEGPLWHVLRVFSLIDLERNTHVRSSRSRLLTSLPADGTLI